MGRRVLRAGFITEPLYSKGEIVAFAKCPSFLFRDSLKWMKSKVLQHLWEEGEAACLRKAEWVEPCCFLGNSEGPFKRPLEGVTHTCLKTHGFVYVLENKFFKFCTYQNRGPQMCFEKLELGSVASTFSIISSVLRSFSCCWEGLPGAVGNVLARVNPVSYRWPQAGAT